MTNFIFMLLLIICFGGFLFYCIYKSVLQSYTETGEQTIFKKFYNCGYSIVFPEISSENVIVTPKLLKEFENEDGYSLLSTYFGMTLILKTYKIKETDEFVATGFFYNSKLVTAFLTKA